MSLVSETFDGILTEIRQNGEIFQDEIIRRMEPAFVAEGFRASRGTQPSRILIVRLDEIGDCVLTSPFLRELRRAYPQAQIDFVVKSGAYPLMELCPYVDHVRIAEGVPASGSSISTFLSWIRSFCEMLWHQQYDLCLVPHWDIDDTYTVLLSYFCGAQERVGFDEHCHPIKATQERGMNKFLTRPVMTPFHVVHEVEKNLALLKAGLGIQSKSDHLELWIAQGDMEVAKARLQAGGITTPYIAVAVGTGAERKTYPPELLARALMGIQAGLPFVLLGGPGEKKEGETVAAALRLAHFPVLDLVGAMPLRQSAAIVAMAQLYMGGDTGLTHVAAAAKRSIVEWFCHPKNAPVSVLSLLARFSPWQAHAAILQPKRPMPGCETMEAGFQEIAGCRSRDKAHCICGIRPESITAAAKRMLEVQP